MEIDTCRVLLTGASGGIGQALVAQLCAGGAQLLLVGRDANVLEALKQGFPSQVQYVLADLSRRDGREAVLAAATAFGGLNCVINAAGINQFSLFADQDEEDLARLIDTNLTAPLQLTRRLLPLLKQQPRALLLNVGSTFGTIGYAGFSAYSASKFALRGFSEALRRELADTPIKVLYLAPRATRTTMNSAPVVALNASLGVAMDMPDTVAAAIVDSLRTERAERHLGWPEKLFVSLNSLLPRLVDRALRKQLGTIKHFAHPLSEGDTR